MNAPVAAALPTDDRAQVAAMLRIALNRLEMGDDSGFDQHVDEVMRDRQRGLYTHLARLSRGLNQQVRAMHQGEQIAHLATDGMPDARHRLDYIMRMTEKAAHRTLDLVDQAHETACSLTTIADRLVDIECDLAVPHPDVPQARQTIRNLGSGLRADAQGLRLTLTALSQAQEYQDISGQLIKRVITLVCNVEAVLHELLRGSDGSLQFTPGMPTTSQAGVLAGPAVAGIGPAAATQQDADSLLSELGF
ncbi:MAG: protein phosphatase CheZ [Pseudomonadota bacterium]|nr:protein phosphatase CheZ [Pseudomonadota bacterium]